MNPKTLPTIMILLSVASALVYAWNGDAKRAIYWFSAAMLTWSVTY